jgi:hypothetical protein
MPELTLNQSFFLELPRLEVVLRIGCFKSLKQVTSIIGR